MSYRSETILIVDDEVGIRDVYQKFLEGDGYSCWPAGSGKEALDSLDTENVDLALVDMMMPGMTGLTLFEHLQERYPELPVIFATAVDDTSLAVDYLKGGVSDFLVKPVPRMRLLRSVQEALSHRAAMFDNHQQPGLPMAATSRFEQESDPEDEVQGFMVMDGASEQIAASRLAPSRQPGRPPLSTGRYGLKSAGGMARTGPMSPTGSLLGRRGSSGQEEDHVQALRMEARRTAFAPAGNTLPRTSRQLNLEKSQGTEDIVSIMFTDLEGSTSLLDLLGDETHIRYFAGRGAPCR